MIKSHTNSKIIIVGGGAAGYLTALYINKLYPNTDMTLIEDPDTPPIQVGESGNVLFTEALEFLGIDFLDWSYKTQNIIKLGGILKGWKGDDDSWFHSRISHYQSLMTDKQTDLEYLKGLIKSNIPIYKTLLHGYAFDNRIVPYVENKNYNWPCTMYHFDSRENARYLKSVAEVRGINIVYGKVVGQIKSNNMIESILLEDNRKINSDWVFDCSGIKKLILKNNFDVTYRDLSRYFLARSVFTWVEEDDRKRTFATDIIARKYGWQWSIDTRRRRGNGYVYSKDFIDQDSAIAEIEKSLGKKIKIQAAFDWTIEYAEKVSKSNVIAVGLSAGFLEPLEANGILMIVKTLNAVKDHWNPRGPKIDNKKINDIMLHTVIETTEFLTMHYQCDRKDTDFWKEFKSIDYGLPYNLKFKLNDLDEFLNTDKSFLDFNYSTYSIESWLMILQATKQFKYVFQNRESIENLYRITNQYTRLLNNAASLDKWAEHVSRE